MRIAAVFVEFLASVAVACVAIAKGANAGLIGIEFSDGRARSVRRRIANLRKQRQTIQYESLVKHHREVLLEFYEEVEPLLTTKETIAEVMLQTYLTIF